MTTTETVQARNPGNVAVITSETEQPEVAEERAVGQDGLASSNGEEANGELEELDLVFQFLPKEGLRRGDIIDGIVLDAARDGLLVDIQQKSEGWVPIRETRLLTDEEGDDALRKSATRSYFTFHGPKALTAIQYFRSTGRAANTAGATSKKLVKPKRRSRGE